MNNIGSSQENKGVVENISKSIEEYVSSTKDSIVNNQVVNKGSEVFKTGTQVFSTAVNNMNMEKLFTTKKIMKPALLFGGKESIVSFESIVHLPFAQDFDQLVM